MVANTCKPRRLRQKDCHKFKASLDYTTIRQNKQIKSIWKYTILVELEIKGSKFD